jgi:hypothetical protein
MEPEPKPVKKRIKDMTADEKRAYDTAHKRKSRVKEKIADEEEQRLKELEKAGIKRHRANLCFFGEVLPGTPARTLPELIKCLREFLRTLGEEDVRVGKENTAELGQRTWQAYLTGPYTVPQTHYCYDRHEIYVPCFSLVRQDFDSNEGYVLDPDDFHWEPTDAELKPITHGMLLSLAIKPVYRVEQPKPAEPIKFEQHHRSVRDYNSTLDEPFMNSQTGQLRIPSSDLDPVAQRFLMGQR